MHPDKGQGPLVSIALCTYNGSRYIREQLESLLLQDYPRLEIIVCDDRSSDDTVSIVSSYKDSRITQIVINETNLGFRGNFAKAFELCRGDLIAPSDQDDIWLPNKISTLVINLIAGKHTMVYCDSAYVAEDGTPLHRNLSDDIPTYSGNDPTALSARNCVSGHAMLFRREVLESAQPIPKGQYHDWWIAMAAASMGSVQFIDKPLVKFRRHAGTQTSIGRTSNRKISRPALNKVDETKLFMERLTFAWSKPTHPDHARLEPLLAAYEKWRTSWLCPELSWIIWRHRKQIFPGEFRVVIKRCARALRYFWGLRLKRFITPSRYP